MHLREVTSRCVTRCERCAVSTRDITPRSPPARLPPSPAPSTTVGGSVPQSVPPFARPAFLSSPTSISSVSLLSLPHLLLIMRASNAPYGRSPALVKTRVETLADDVSGAAFANDKGVCIPAPLLLQRLETLTQIDTQLGPTITISASPLLPASLHPCLAAPPSHICLHLSASICLPLLVSSILSSSYSCSFPPAPFNCHFSHLDFILNR